MNRIRTIATAGIVAGSVAFAAALLSSGGVGASFVDAAEAGVSITVADHLEGLDDSCDFKIHFGNKEIDLSDLFDLSQFGQDDGNGHFSATFTFDFSSSHFDALWNVVLAGGLSGSWSQQDNDLSVTFTWSWTPSLHVTGSAAITLNCTPHPDDDSGSGDGGTDGDHNYNMKSMGLTSGNTVNSLSMNLDSDSSTGPDSMTGSDLSADTSDTTDAPETFTFEALIDLPAADSSCEPSATETSTTGTVDSTSCTTDDPSEPDCAPGGADVPDLEKCPPATTTSSPVTTTTEAPQLTTSAPPPAATTSPAAPEPTTSDPPATTTSGSDS